MTRLAFVILCFPLVACGDDDTATPDAPRDAPRADAAVDAGPTGDAAPLSAYLGTWAFREVMATVAQAPIIGPVDDRAVTIGKVTVTPATEGLTLVVETCDLRLETDNSSITTSLLPGYPATLPDAPYAAHLLDGELEAIGTAELQGCVLTDPVNEPLPTSSTDPQVRDTDGDGHPGFTVVTNVTGIGEVRIYMVERTRRDFVHGHFTAPDRVAGRLAVHQFDEVVLGATNDLFATTPEIVPNEAGSSFTLVRIDAATDCGAITSQDELTLFGPR